MCASTSVGNEGYGTRVPWGDVVLSAIASVSWALIGMAGTAALGLRLLDADAAGSLGPMTAAAVALGAGGSVRPSGDVSAFGLKGAEAHTAIEITPLGVGLVGAVLLSFFFLRSLRAAGVVVAPAELLARAGTVTVLFVAMLGGLAWAGHDVVTIDGGKLGLDDLPGGAGAGVEVPGLGDLGDLGGLLPDRIGDLAGAEAAVGFRVETAPTLLGGLVWCVGVLLVALLASRRTPLPRGCEAVHRVVRPAVSALVTVALTAVAAGYAAAVCAAVGDDHPRRIAGAALLGAPNGVWLGVPIGLFVPWDGRATGVLTRFLPDPLDDLLGTGADEPVTLGRLAELDGRVWLLGVAAASLMLLAGVLTAARTPVADVPGFAGRCALRLGIATALALPLAAVLTEVSVDASLSVLGIDAFGAGIDLRGRLGAALLLGAAWGAGAGAAGALLARATGAAGRRATPTARGAAPAGVGPFGTVGDGGAGLGGAADVPEAGGAVLGWPYGNASGAGGADGVSRAVPSYGPYGSGGEPYRPSDPGTNPYMRPSETSRGPEDARPPGAEADPPGERPSDDDGDDLYGAETVVGPLDPSPRPPGPGNRPASRWGEGPPPPPPPPPAPPRPPRDGQ
ncbi:streptophobe family protein [Streptomyces sp. NPDC048219]|uniref:streptophobe family protein n=1 Tax=Streptomyces sp. NPDC048219 TaxID=3365517 RepID=UPI00371FD5BD